MTSFDFHRVPLRWSPFFFEDFLAEKLRKSMCVVANLGGGLGGLGGGDIKIRGQEVSHWGY